MLITHIFASKWIIQLVWGACNFCSSNLLVDVILAAQQRETYHVFQNFMVHVAMYTPKDIL